MQPLQGVGEGAEAVDQAKAHRLLAVDDAAHVIGQLIGIEEHLEDHLLIEGAGHAVHTDKPHEFTSAVKVFLGNI